MAKGTKKPKAKDAGRRRKKKVSVLTQEGIGYVDWKDINLLRRFMSDRAKIRARQVTGNNQQQQKEIARAIKNAREMALLPYNNRITTQRSASRMRDDGRIDGPAPQPTEPPPGMRGPSDMDGDELEALEIGDTGMAPELADVGEAPGGEFVADEVVADEVVADEAPAEVVADEAPAEVVADEAPSEPVADEVVAAEAPDEPVADDASDEAPAEVADETPAAAASDSEEASS